MAIVADAGQVIDVQVLAIVTDAGQSRHSPSFGHRSRCSNSGYSSHFFFSHLMFKIKPQRPRSIVGFVGTYRDKSYKHSRDNSYKSYKMIN
jgi:hypothetical protein